MLALEISKAVFNGHIYCILINNTLFPTHNISKTDMPMRAREYSAEEAKTEKDINTLLPFVLKHIKMGWSIKLNVAFEVALVICCSYS